MITTISYYADGKQIHREFNLYSDAVRFMEMLKKQEIHFTISTAPVVKMVEEWFAV